VNGPLVLVLSAKTPEQLLEKARNLLDFVDVQLLTDQDLVNLCYTLQVGREPMAERAATTIDSLESLKDKLTLLVHAKGQTSNLVEWKRGSIKNNKETLSEFDSDEDAKSLLSIWLTKGKYDRLLELWVKGLSFNWQRLYENSHQPRRLSLPAYPFARERYWLDIPTENIELTDEQTNHKSTDELNFIALLDESLTLFLKDEVSADDVIDITS
jgi:acyl transferase domain-containing protein